MRRRRSVESQPRDKWKKRNLKRRKKRIKTNKTGRLLENNKNIGT